MKQLICFLLIFNSVVAISQGVVGVYQFQSGFKESNDFELLRTLTLNADGTFEYHNYRYVEKGIPKDTHKYGKGTWTQNKKVIYFSSEASDLDEKFTLDFTGTKARFISKSPRDKSAREIKTSMQFYESKIPWIKGMTLIKK